jgi:hypothetical protein
MSDSLIPIVIGAAILLVVLVVLMIVVRRNWTAFEEKFPPISDAEFLARCRPGTDPAVALKVRRIIADWLGVEYERIHPSLSFVQDIATD